MGVERIAMYSTILTEIALPSERSPDAALCTARDKS